MLTDTHAHYDDEAFDGDREEVFAALAEAGVRAVIDPAVTVETSRRILTLAEQHPFLYAAVGVHPENCFSYSGAEIEELRALARHPKCVAIGEIGLDYHFEENPPRELQKKCFAEQLALAEETGLPVIVHDRDAHADSMEIIAAFPRVRGVFHCFSGSAEMAKELLRRGWYLGFDGPLTYKNARRTVEAAAVCPPERLLLETDAPYMAPVPVRGTRNDSRNLVYVAEKLAEVKGLPYEELLRLTEENANRLFRLANAD